MGDRAFREALPRQRPGGSRRILDASLSTPSELSGALNRALPALRSVQRQGRFSETRTTRREGQGFREAFNPCAWWLNAETSCAPAAMMSQDHLYSAYAQACLNSNRPLITKQMFGRKLRQLKPELQEAQRVLDGKKQWVYLGLSLKEAGVASS